MEYVSMKSQIHQGLGDAMDEKACYMCISGKRNSLIQPLRWCSTSLHSNFCCHNLPTKCLQGAQNNLTNDCRQMHRLNIKHDTSNWTKYFVTTWYWLSRALQGMLIHGNSSKMRIRDFIASAFGHSMTPIMGPWWWCLSQIIKLKLTFQNKHI